MRVLIADSRPQVRFALSALLRQQPGLEAVGEAGDVEELLVKVTATRPDLVLLDWRLRGKPMAELVPEMRRLRPGLRVIVLSERPDASREALEAGADAFVSKADHPEKLLSAIAEVGSWCNPRGSQSVL